MPGCEALNFSATCCSTATCSGASPVPRQQYQRISTSPGFAAEPLSGILVGAADAASDGAALSDDDGDGSTLAAVDGAAAETAGDAELAVDEQAATMITSAASSAAEGRMPLARSRPGRLAADWLTDGRIEILLLSVLVRGPRPARANDDTFHVIARAIAPDIGPPEFDRGAIGRRRDAFDQERRCARAPAEQPRLTGTEQDRLESLTGARDVHAVSLGQHVVEGPSLEIAREQSREPFGRPVALLEQERFTIREPQPFQAQGRRAGIETERLGDRLPGSLRPSRDEPGLGIVAARLHLLGEAERIREVDVETWCEHEGPTAPRPLEAAVAHHLAQRAPDRDQAAAVALGEVALRREAVARPPLTGVQRRSQVEIDLMMQRDRAQLESETGHRRVGGLRMVRAIRGSCAPFDC